MKKNLYSKCFKLALLAILTLTLQITLVKAMECPIRPISAPICISDISALYNSFIEKKMELPKRSVSAPVGISGNKLRATLASTTPELDYEDFICQGIRIDALTNRLVAEADGSKLSTFDKVLFIVDGLTVFYNTYNIIDVNVTLARLGDNLRKAVAVGDVDAINEYGCSPLLYFTVCQNKPESVKILLMAGAKVESENYKIELGSKTENSILDVVINMVMKWDDQKINFLKSLQALINHYNEKGILIPSYLKPRLVQLGVRGIEVRPLSPKILQEKAKKRDLK